MESALSRTAAATPIGTRIPCSSCKRSLSKKSRSFRLHSPSLNSLRLRRIFDLFDKDGDGLLTVSELNQALNLLGLEVDFTELESTVKSYVRPGNKGLQFDDFVGLHRSLDDIIAGEDVEDADDISHEDSDLAEAFKVFDEDGDGYISAKELQVVLGKLGLPQGNEITRVEQMICSVDQNHDGRVDFFEFKHMMSGVLVKSS